MAHNIQSMMYYGEVPWHELGVRLDKPVGRANFIKATRDLIAGKLAAGGQLAIHVREIK